MEVSGIKKVIEIIFNNEFEDVEGFSDFKREHLPQGKKDFFINYWNQQQALDKYLSTLGK